MPVYVITGTNRGIGLEFVRQLAPSPENTVICTVRTLQKSHDELNSIIQRSRNRNVDVLELDTGDVTSIVRFGDELQRLLQGKKIDYLINNSGINSTREDTSLTLTPESFREHMDVNVIGPQQTVAVLTPQLSVDTVILNMTSGLGSLETAVDRISTGTTSWATTYSISKAALNMLTIHQALDLKDKVRAVIAMNPGWVKTDMGGANAPMEPKASISGMLKIIHGVTKEDTAKFYNSRGHIWPW